MHLELLMENGLKYDFHKSSPSRHGVNTLGQKV
jgi:hypothetical protein